MQETKHTYLAENLVNQKGCIWKIQEGNIYLTLDIQTHLIQALPLNMKHLASGKVSYTRTIIIKFILLEQQR